MFFVSQFIHFHRKKHIMMEHLLGSVPNKHALLHLQIELFYSSSNFALIKHTCTHRSYLISTAWMICFSMLIHNHSLLMPRCICVLMGHWLRNTPPPPTHSRVFDAHDACCVGCVCVGWLSSTQHVQREMEMKGEGEILDCITLFPFSSLHPTTPISLLPPPYPLFASRQASP